jgi:very-short-patch-repair endonuclease
VSEQNYIDNASNWLTGYLEYACDELRPACESPIEVGLLYGFIALRLTDRRFKLAGLRTSGPILTEWCAEVHLQHEVGPYRLDFAIHITDGAKLSKWIAVECDGHNYHERTKEQAQRDKARDRELAQMGFHVFRFTGSEIYRNNIACVLEIQKFAIGLAEAAE